MFSRRIRSSASGTALTSALTGPCSTASASGPPASRIAETARAASPARMMPYTYTAITSIYYRLLEPEPERLRELEPPELRDFDPPDPELRDRDPEDELPELRPELRRPEEEPPELR